MASKLFVEDMVESKAGDGAEPDVLTTGVGELNFDEYARGGLGRHLGLFSTTFLMCVHPSIASCAGTDHQLG
jgi:hypothetical protein